MQSAYYPGPSRLSKDEIVHVSHCLERNHIYPENTRIQKNVRDGQTNYSVLQASIEKGTVVEQLPTGSPDLVVCLARGDHSAELHRICEELSKALDYTANAHQTAFISQYIQSFQTGNLELYRDSQRSWVKDKGPEDRKYFWIRGTLS